MSPFQSLSKASGYSYEHSIFRPRSSQPLILSIDSLQSSAVAKEIIPSLGTILFASANVIRIPTLSLTRSARSIHVHSVLKFLTTKAKTVL